MGIDTWEETVFMFETQKGRGLIQGGKWFVTSDDAFGICYNFVTLVDLFHKHLCDYFIGNVCSPGIGWTCGAMSLRSQCQLFWNSLFATSKDHTKGNPENAQFCGGGGGGGRSCGLTGRARLIFSYQIVNRWLLLQTGGSLLIYRIYYTSEHQEQLQLPLK